MNNNHGVIYVTETVRSTLMKAVINVPVISLRRRSQWVNKPLDIVLITTSTRTITAPMISSIGIDVSCEKASDLFIVYKHGSHRNSFFALAVDMNHKVCQFSLSSIFP